MIEDLGPVETQRNENCQMEVAHYFTQYVPVLAQAGIITDIGDVWMLTDHLKYIAQLQLLAYACTRPTELILSTACTPGRRTNFALARWHVDAGIRSPEILFVYRGYLCASREKGPIAGDRYVLVPQ